MGNIAGAMHERCLLRHLDGLRTSFKNKSTIHFCSVHSRNLLLIGLTLHIAPTETVTNEIYFCIMAILKLYTCTLNMAVLLCAIKV